MSQPSKGAPQGILLPSSDHSLASSSRGSLSQKGVSFPKKTTTFSSEVSFASKMNPKLDQDLQIDMMHFLGEGPMRFGPGLLVPEMPVKRQLTEGGGSQLGTYISIRARSELKKKRRVLTDAQLLRIVQFCHFDEESSHRLMKKCRPRYFSLTALDRQMHIEGQKLMVPLPGLHYSKNPTTPSASNTMSRVVYFRPSRYFPREGSKAHVIDTLIYILDNWTRYDAVVLSKHTFIQSRVSYVLLVNLTDFQSSNYSRDYWSKLMAVLQGKAFPVKVHRVLWMDQPEWFNRVWNSMKSMMVSQNFRNNNFRFPRSELHNYLQGDIQDVLPTDEFPVLSNADSSKESSAIEGMARDYILFQQYIETFQGKTAMPKRKTSGRRRRRFSMPIKVLMRRPKKKKDDDGVMSIGSHNEFSQHTDDDAAHEATNGEKSGDPEQNGHPTSPSGRPRRRRLKARRESHSLSNDDFDAINAAVGTAPNSSGDELQFESIKGKRTGRRSSFDLSSHRRGTGVMGGKPVKHVKPRRSSLSILNEMQEYQPKNRNSATAVDISAINKKKGPHRKVLKVLKKPLKVFRGRRSSKQENGSLSEISESYVSEFEQSFHVSALVSPAPTRGHVHSETNISTPSDHYGSIESDQMEDSNDWSKILKEMSKGDGTPVGTPQLLKQPHVGTRRHSTSVMAPPLTGGGSVEPDDDEDDSDDEVESDPETEREKKPVSKKKGNDLTYFLQQVEKKKERTRRLQLQRKAGTGSLS